MKKYFLSIDSSNGILSDYIANVEYDYKTQGSSGIKKGDYIVGYVDHPINKFQMIFSATSDALDDICYFKKLVDFGDGVDPSLIDGANSTLDQLKASPNDFIEVEDILYEDICTEMVKNIGESFSIDEKDEVPDDESLKEKFRSYVLNVRKLKNDRMVNELGKLSLKMKAAGVISKDVYSISDIEEYDEVLKTIRDSEEYKTEKEEKKEKSPHSGLIIDQGLSNYKLFLEYLNNFLNIKTGIHTDVPRNKIYFGAPGTGKSHKLEEDWEKLFGDKETSKEYYERVTFYQDYSYANFVGSYKPTKDDDGDITYEFVPGPFITTYIKAIRNAQGDEPFKPYLLLIEEINRAPAAAVFGDMFQLLDRDSERLSAYEVNTSADLRKYLSKELNMKPEVFSKIKIPDNMFIWATMNSADQGVFPIDTAFKRRWEFEYLGINNKESEIEGYSFELKNGKKYSWNDLRKAINGKLAELKVNEDKMMGAFFLPKWVMGSEDNTAKQKAIKDKVLMYLFEDAAKQKRGQIFIENEGVVLYSDLCERFDGKDGLAIFSDDIVKKVSELTEDSDPSEVENSEDENKEGSEVEMTISTESTEE